MDIVEKMLVKQIIKAFAKKEFNMRKLTEAILIVDLENESIQFTGHGYIDEKLSSATSNKKIEDSKFGKELSEFVGEYKEGEISIDMEKSRAIIKKVSWTGKIEKYEI